MLHTGTNYSEYLTMMKKSTYTMVHFALAHCSLKCIQEQKWMKSFCWKTPRIGSSWKCRNCHLNPCNRLVNEKHVSALLSWNEMYKTVLKSQIAVTKMVPSLCWNMFESVLKLWKNVVKMVLIGPGRNCMKIEVVGIWKYWFSLRTCIH